MTSTLFGVDDDTPKVNEAPALPGTPLASGFLSGAGRRGARLSPEAQARVLDKMKSVDQARFRAAQDSRTAYVG